MKYTGIFSHDISYMKTKTTNHAIFSVKLIFCSCVPMNRVSCQRKRHPSPCCILCRWGRPKWVNKNKAATNKRLATAEKQKTGSRTPRAHEAQNEEQLATWNMEGHDEWRVARQFFNLNGPPQQKQKKKKMGPWNSNSETFRISIGFSHLLLWLQPVFFWDGLKDWQR